jgi:hypothetical protein
MRREFQVRFCEGLGVRFPRATQPGVSYWRTRPRINGTSTPRLARKRHQIAPPVRPAQATLPPGARSWVVTLDPQHSPQGAK